LGLQVKDQVRGQYLWPLRPDPGCCPSFCPSNQVRSDGQRWTQ